MRIQTKTVVTITVGVASAGDVQSMQKTYTSVIVVRKKAGKLHE